MSKPLENAAILSLSGKSPFFDHFPGLDMSCTRRIWTPSLRGPAPSNSPTGLATLGPARFARARFDGKLCQKNLDSGIEGALPPQTPPTLDSNYERMGWVL